MSKRVATSLTGHVPVSPATRHCSSDLHFPAGMASMSGLLDRIKRFCLPKPPETHHKLTDFERVLLEAGLHCSEGLKIAKEDALMKPRDGVERVREEEAADDFEGAANVIDQGLRAPKEDIVGLRAVHGDTDKRTLASLLPAPPKTSFSSATPWQGIPWKLPQ